MEKIITQALLNPTASDKEYLEKIAFTENEFTPWLPEGQER